MTRQEKHDGSCTIPNYEYEFPKGKFKNGWRGDRKCINCDYTFFSSEAMRMSMFGLGQIIPPTKEQEDNKDSLEANAFLVGSMVVV